VLDHRATILHDEDAGARKLARYAIIADAELEPDGVRLQFE
jgi:hypothetical protein